MIRSKCCGAEIVNAPDGDGAMCRKCFHPATWNQTEELARELYNVGTKAAEMNAGGEFWSYDEARPAQQYAARAIAAHVLDNFERKAAR